MAQWHLKSNRKKTGGMMTRHSKKKKHQQGRDFLPTHVGETKRKTLRTMGGNRKMVALAANVAIISTAGKAQKTKILAVAENSADSQYVRRNIITKGAIINTEMGRARVTSRPGQTGVVNAVLVEDKKPTSRGKK
jgi:small subunit ribosomal protein S8e